MTIEVLFPEVCGLYGDHQNPTYLSKTLPDATFVYTPLTQVPYFTDHDVDLIYMGTMSEETQRQVIEILRPWKDRILELVDKGVVILATGNAGEVFMKHIDYVTEEKSIDGLGIFDLTVVTDLFKRRNGKVLGKLEDMEIVGFQSLFSEVHGDNSQNFFLRCQRGKGIHPGTDLEGVRLNNLICTQLIGPILPLNPLFTEYLLKLAGVEATAAFKDVAMDAYRQRLKEFSDPAIPF